MRVAFGSVSTTMPRIAALPRLRYVETTTLRGKGSTPPSASTPTPSTAAATSECGSTMVSAAVKSTTTLEAAAVEATPSSVAAAMVETLEVSPGLWEATAIALAEFSPIAELATSTVKREMIRSPLSGFPCLLIAARRLPVLHAVARALGRLRVLTCSSFPGRLQTVRVGPLDRVPSVGAMLLPLAVIATVDVAVTPGINIATLASGDKPAVTLRVLPVQSASIPGRSAADPGKLAAVLNHALSPRAVDVLATAGG